VLEKTEEAILSADFLALGAVSHLFICDNAPGEMQRTSIPHD
jgi:hypothetical protein